MDSLKWGLVAATVGFLMFDLGQATAADTEIRSYTIQVDGKHAGDYQLNIQTHPDGTVVVAAQSDVKVTVLAVPVYTYTYHGQEVWKNGRLHHFESTGKENGKNFVVQADLDGPSIRVAANGHGFRVRSDVWTTSWWHLPDAQFRNHEVVVFGCSDGAEVPTHLGFVGNEQRVVAGQVQPCTHYHIVKDTAHDLWYDAQDRLVRDEWVSDGHKTVIELTAVRR